MWSRASKVLPTAVLGSAPLATNSTIAPSDTTTPRSAPSASIAIGSLIQTASPIARLLHATQHTSPCKFRTRGNAYGPEHHHRSGAPAPAPGIAGLARWRRLARRRHLAVFRAAAGAQPPDRSIDLGL